MSARRGATVRVGTALRRASLDGVLATLVLLLVGCVSQEERVSDANVRRYFAIPSSDSLTERRILNALENQLPQGTPRYDILNYLEQRDLGRDSLTQLLYSDTSSEIVVRIGEAPSTEGDNPRL